MSELDSMVTPPPSEFTSDNTGIIKWRPVFDGITVYKVFNGVRLSVTEGEKNIVFVLNTDQARHIAALLSEAAE